MEESIKDQALKELREEAKRNAIGAAKFIIVNIAKEQTVIAEAKKRIEKFQTELAAVAVQEHNV